MSLPLNFQTSHPFGVEAMQNAHMPLPVEAFGAAEWNTYFGDIGEVPPLPSDIYEILESSCAFWPDKKVKETHFLCLIPKTVNGVPLTLDSLEELVQRPNQGTPTKYSYYNEYVQKEHGSTRVEQSHWILMTKDIVPGSRAQSYNQQKALVEKVSNYELPPVLEAATVIFMHTYKTGSYIYTAQEFEPKITFTRCKEKMGGGKWAVWVGGHSEAGLRVHRYFDYIIQSHGAAGFRKLL